jgi:hypothetical protein
MVMIGSWAAVEATVEDVPSLPYDLGMMDMMTPEVGSVTNVLNSNDLPPQAGGTVARQVGQPAG